MAQKYVLISCMACTILVSLLSFAQKNSRVEVNYYDQRLFIHVTKPTDLSVILDTICRSTNFDCQIPAGLPAAPVAVANFEGAWEEVVGRLLQGTTLNYVVLRPKGPMMHGKFLITRISSFAQILQNQSPKPVSVNAVETAPIVPLIPESQEDRSNSNFNFKQNGMQSKPIASDPRHMFFPEPSNQAQATVTFRSGAPRMLPWPDASGKTIFTTSSEGIRTLPWPDANGKPIVVPFIGGQWTLPWPDANGNPIFVHHDH